MPTLLYSRIPAEALRTEIDGNVYATIPHRLAHDGSGLRVVEDFSRPRMVVFGASSFIRGGEAFVYFAQLGDAIPVTNLPFGVTAEPRDAAGRILPFTYTPPCA